MTNATALGRRLATKLLEGNAIDPTDSTFSPVLAQLRCTRDFVEPLVLAVEIMSHNRKNGYRIAPEAIRILYGYIEVFSVINNPHNNFHTRITRAVDEASNSAELWDIIEYQSRASNRNILPWALSKITYELRDKGFIDPNINHVLYENGIIKKPEFTKALVTNIAFLADSCRHLNPKFITLLLSDTQSVKNLADPRNYCLGRLRGAIEKADNRQELQAILDRSIQLKEAISTYHKPREQVNHADKIISAEFRQTGYRAA